MLLEIAQEFWNALAEMSPYLLFGFLVAGVLSVLFSAEMVERHLGGRGFLQVAKATLFGIPLPLCSCGVIPTAASLRRHGAGKGATTAFLLSTPQTGVDSIFVTFSLLGPVFAIYRPLAALVTGLAGGVLVSRFDHEPASSSGPQPAGGACEDTACDDDACNSGGGALAAGPAGRRGRWLEGLRYGFVTLPRDIARSMLAGLLIAGVLAVVIPDDFFAGALGDGLPGMLLMMLIGLPMYVCSTASVPIAAALIAKGLSPGAALVFLMTGPATNAVTISTVWRTMGRRTGAIYLASAAACALAMGYLLNLLFDTLEVAPAAHHAGMVPAGLGNASAGALLAVLLLSLLPRKAAPQARPEDGVQSVTLPVTGMTCSHCAQSVRRALEECPGVARAEVDLQGGMATVAGKDLNRSALAAAIRGAGYETTVP